MWFYVPQKWYEIPGVLWTAWTSGRAEARRADARPRETPSRAATTHAEAARAGRRALRAMSVRKVREQVEAMRPKKCCKGGVMIAGGKRQEMCSEDCQWQKLDLLIATASVDAEV